MTDGLSWESQLRDDGDVYMRQVQKNMVGDLLWASEWEFSKKFTKQFWKKAGKGEKKIFINTQKRKERLRNENRN